MNTETLSRTLIGRVFIKVLASGMESRFRYKHYPPEKILKSVPDMNGLKVLEIGCGTGFYTIPIARLIGDNGSLTSIDILQESVDLVRKKTESAGLKNVNILKRDVINTDLPSGSFDQVILFGVLPAPMLSLNKVLSEISRLLKPEGVLSIWPSIPGLQRSVRKSGIFLIKDRKNGVFNCCRN